MRNEFDQKYLKQVNELQHEHQHKQHLLESLQREYDARYLALEKKRSQLADVEQQVTSARNFLEVCTLQEVDSAYFYRRIMRFSKQTPES